MYIEGGKRSVLGLETFRSSVFSLQSLSLSLSLVLAMSFSVAQSSDKRQHGAEILFSFWNA